MKIIKLFLKMLFIPRKSITYFFVLKMIKVLTMLLLLLEVGLIDLCISFWILFPSATICFTSRRLL